MALLLRRRGQVHGEEDAGLGQFARADDPARRAVRAYHLSVSSIHQLEIRHVLEEDIDMDDMIEKADEHLLHALAALGVKRPYFSARVSDAMAANVIKRPSSGPMPTRREWEVAQLVAEACNPKDIACRLALGTMTVETHRASAMRKLGRRRCPHSRIALAASSSQR